MGPQGVQVGTGAAAVPAAAHVPRGQRGQVALLPRPAAQMRTEERVGAPRRGAVKVRGEMVVPGHKGTARWGCSSVP